MGTENIQNKFVEKTSEESDSYREIFFNDHTVMLLIDPVTLRIVDANLAAKNFYGYNLDEFLKLKISDINVASNDFVLDKIQKSVSKEKNHFIFKHRLSNGEIREVDVYSGLIKHNGKNVLYSIIHDITDDELQNTLKRLYTILSSMYGAILLISDTHHVEFVNQSFCDFFKLNELPEELMGLEDYEIIERIRNVYLNPDEAILRIKEIVRLEEPVKGEEVELQDGRTCIRDFIPLKISKKSYGRLWHHTDITELKNAENKIRESENKFRTFFENIMDALLLTIPDGNIMAANPAAEKLFGYTEEEICKIGRKGLLDTEDPNLKILIEERALKGSTRGELTFIRKDGTKFPGEMSTSVFKDGNGNERTSMVIRDVTRRKRAEQQMQDLLEKEQQLTEELQTSNEELQSTTEELHKSNEELVKTSKLLSAIYELNPDAIVLTTVSDSKIIDCNQEYLNQIGYSLEEIIGHTSKELNLISEVTRDAYIDETRRNNKVSNIEVRGRRKDGSLIDLLYSTRQITVDNVPMILNIGHDITERKRIEEKLVFQSDLLSRVQDAIVAIDKNFNIIYWNEIAQKMFGWTRKEVLGKNSNELFQIKVENDSLDNLSEQLLREGTYVGDVYFLRKDGTYLPVEINVKTFTNKKGEVTNMLASVRDISVRKQKDKKLNAAMDELVRSNQELERFAYVSSHDLQEPLRMVTLYSQLLERRYKDRLDTDADDFIEYIVENARRMKQLIDDLLEYSRVTSQAQEFENIEMKKTLDTVLANLSIIIVENNVKITQEPLPTVFADQNQMLRVFQNLITNAIKFRGEKSPEINISAEKGNKEWIICVKDNGIGIKPEHQKQIFEVFKRLHTREEYPGTGIGLSIVQKIIKHHDGRIWVESEPGAGSSFYFTIPIK